MDHFGVLQQPGGLAMQEFMRTQAPPQQTPPQQTPPLQMEGSPMDMASDAFRQFSASTPQPGQGLRAMQPRPIDRMAQQAYDSSLAKVRELYNPLPRPQGMNTNARVSTLSRTEGPSRTPMRPNQPQGLRLQSLSRIE